MLTDIVSSTEEAAGLADAAWRALVARRGSHDLKGIPGTWEIHAVTSDTAP